MNNLMKKLVGGVAVISMAMGIFISQSAVAAAPNYDVTGAYVVSFEYLGSNYAHDVNLTQTAGTLTGNGGSPAGSNVYTWVIDSGTVSGNDINFTAHYTATADAVTPLTTMIVTGTISLDGTMGGTWSDNYQGGIREGTWMTTSGTATSIVDQTAPAVPTHLSPANGSTLTSVALDKIDWTDVTDASSPVVYFYESSNSAAINLDGSFVSPVYQSATLSASEIATAGTGEGLYFWHVRAQDNAGNSSNWSAAWSFTIDNDVVVVPTVPKTKDECKNGGWMTFTNPTFKNQGQCVSYVATRKHQ